MSILVPVLAGVFVVVFIGGPVIAAAVAWERLEKGRRCKPAPVWRRWMKPLGRRADGLWARRPRSLAALLAWLETPDEPVPAPRRPVNGRYLGTRPRREGPFTAVDMPALAEAGPEPAPVETCQVDPAVPIARPFAPQPTWGEACEIDVAEAERQFALAMGPDGQCEEIR